MPQPRPPRKGTALPKPRVGMETTVCGHGVAPHPEAANRPAMKTATRLVACLLMSSACSSSKPSEKADGPAAATEKKTAASPDDPNIPFEIYKLNNGLTVMLHEDHRVP